MKSIFVVMRVYLKDTTHSTDLLLATPDKASAVRYAEKCQIVRDNTKNEFKALLKENYPTEESIFQYLVKEVHWEEPQANPTPSTQDPTPTPQ